MYLKYMACIFVDSFFFLNFAGISRGGMPLGVNRIKYKI